MNRICGKDKYFIGAVKFFDVKKDFGYIASNNCNMPEPNYDQAFFVNSDSFIENEAKKEGRVVVFQVERQVNGKKRAVNVRRITHSDEDVQLALSYYGEHELIEYKDNRKINLYTHTYKPIGLVAEKVRHIIEDDPERSPEKTAQHFKFFVDHYKKDKYSENHYIFDRHFYTEEKTIWASLLSVFTKEERIEILDNFPSIIKYFNDISLIRHWLEDKLSNDCSLSDLQVIVNIYSFIPKECVDYSTSRIEQIVDTPIKELLHKLSERSDISKKDLDGKSEREYCARTYDSERIQLLHDLKAYLQLTSNDYKKEKTKCLTSVKKNRFKKELSEFVEKKYNDFGRDGFFSYLNGLSSKDLNSFKRELTSSISPILDKAIEEKQYRQVVGDITQLSVMGEEFLNPYKQKLLPLIVDELKEALSTNLNSANRITSVFFSAYEYYTSIFEITEKEEIKQTLTPILKETHSIGVLSEVSVGLHTWLTIDEALALSKQIVSRWGYAEVKQFVEDMPDYFDHSILFADIVIAKAKEIVGTIPLSHFFDGTPLEDGGKNVYSRYPERENCAFLNYLKNLIPDGQRSSEWESYINSRSSEDLLILFEHGVITSLPENIVEMIINAISLDGVYAPKERWYSKPSLQNRTHDKILVTTKVNLFPLIAHRLQSMEISDENVALAVLLTELMTSNMPGDDSDYYKRRYWEENFTSQIQYFWKNNNINPRLSVIIWAVHSKTRTSSAALTEVFPELPPYLQIKIVKKLFKTISEGKITHTAESLYNLLKDGHKPIYFPLEIALSYLKLREKDPSKTLDNNIMLQLLEGREDTEEWIGIRSLVTPCNGRWIAKELPDDRSNWKRNNYFNGLITLAQNDKLRVFIPTKMIDEYGNLKEYNNKHYSRVIQQIQITYNNSEYQEVNENNSVSYYFDKSYEVELFSIARSFNFKFNGLNNYLAFEAQEDDQEDFCECRLSDKVDDRFRIAFYWCGNKPCFRTPVRFRIDNEWEYYTILDFMRILGIPTDYTNKNGKRTKFGHYIILSSYLKSFAKFYEHLKCRECGKLMRPKDITNFASRAVTEFSCDNESCSKNGFVVYLNHCFNKQKCNATIDSRDSKQCPNGQYVCPECGACCSTENFRLRINNLHKTGGVISDRLKLFVENNLGHWEKHEFYCYKCGKPMINVDGKYKCGGCEVIYNI